MNEVGTNGTLSFSFESSREDFYRAACAIDRKSKMDTRRNLQGAALVLVFFMFFPPETLMHWLMLVLCVAIGIMLWKYPDHINQKFAERKASSSPHYQITITDQDITFDDSQCCETIRFSEDCAVYQFRGVLAVSWGKNRLQAIPISRLDEQTAQSLTDVLTKQLGDRFETLSDKFSAGGLFSRRKHR